MEQPKPKLPEPPEFMTAIWHGLVGALAACSLYGIILYFYVVR